jgi:hypothetical protein
MVKTIASSDSSLIVGKPFVVFRSLPGVVEPFFSRVPSPWCSQHRENSPQGVLVNKTTLWFRLNKSPLYSLGSIW